MYPVKNKVQLIGNLGKDPKIIQLKNGKTVVKMDLAINEQFKNKSGEPVTKTQWYTISVWNKLAEIVSKKFKKGNEIKIEGSLSQHTYLDKMGIVRNITEVNCHHIELNRA